MSSKSTYDYASIPKDFPRAHLLSEVFTSHQLCQELVTFILNEVQKEQLRSPLIATPDTNPTLNERIAVLAV